MKSNSKGFTLIEMAIVLVIIGLILGAVTKGKDMVESARQKKFYNSVVKGWQLAFINYADRTGLLLADAPSDTNAKTDDPKTRNGQITGNLANAIAQLEAVDLEPPTSSSVVYYGNYSISIGLGYINGKNLIRFYSAPKSLAIAIDTMVDGEMDPDNGDLTYTVNDDNETAQFTLNLTTF